MPPEENAEEHEKSRGNVAVPVEVLEELMDAAKMGGGELRNKSNPNLEALKRLFTRIYFKLDEYLPEPPAEELSTEKTKG